MGFRGGGGVGGFSSGFRGPKLRVWGLGGFVAFTRLIVLAGFFGFICIKGVVYRVQGSGFSSAFSLSRPPKP